MSVGGNRSPYRPPCGYSADDPERYWLGAPWQHYVAGANGLPIYQNTTTAPGCPSGGTVAPYALLAESTEECGGDDECPCGPWPIPPYEGYTGNTYAPFSPGETANLATCRKVGFKTVFARKFWQGRRGFSDPNDCSGCSFSNAITSTKYLSVSWSATINYDPDPGSENDSILNFTASGSMSVDRYSGKVTGSVSQTFTNSNQYYDPGFFDIDYCINMDGGAAIGGDLNGAFGLNYCGGEWTGGSLAEFLNAGNVDGVVITTASCTPTQITLAYTTTLGAAVTTTTITITLSDAYQSSDVDADVESLLGQWNLADDVQYPWRTDNACTSGPYLSYDESTGNIPQGLVLGGPACPDEGSVTDLTVPITVPGWTGDYVFNWNPVTSGDTYPSSCTFTGTYSDSTTNTGAILGQPLTTIYGTGIVYAPYFDFNFLVYGEVSCGGGEVGYDIVGYGAFGGDVWAFNASQWTNLADASALLPGAFAAYGSAGGGGGLSVTLPACSDGGGTYLPGYLIKSKYAEVILLSAPSHDFDRPCGPKDAATIDQATITTCYGADSPCNLGSLRSTTTWGGLANPCPTDGWNDNHPKGDWLMVNWAFNFRQTPLSVTGAWSGVTFTPLCSMFMPCCPAVVYLSNGGESSTNSQTFTLPALTLDDCYGALWAMAPMQWMTDPLWQVPRMSEACHTASGQWTEDDGSGHGDTDSIFYYPQRPFEEARISVPSGAPALPSNCYLPGMSVSDINTLGSYPTEPNRVIYPPVSGQCFQGAWVIALNRAATIAASTRFSCDYADPFAVCSDNTELAPP
jgi:hypothetical protein